MGKTLNDLVKDLVDETLPGAGEALENLPQFGQFVPPPQPGPFHFKLPADLSACFDLIETKHVTAANPKGTRVALILDQNAPLLITQSHTNNRYKGDTFQTRLNNNERKRGNRDPRELSDFDYLIFVFEPGRAKPKNNKEYIEAIRTYGNREFGADIRWQWSCDPTRNIRVRDAGGAIQEVENRPGCGGRIYQEDIAAELKAANHGEYPLEITCGGKRADGSPCGALLRAFGNVDNIRA